MLDTAQSLINLSPGVVRALENTGTRILYTSIPDAMKDILASLAHRWRADRWDVGDITNGVEAYVVEYKIPASMDDINMFVSELLNSELTPRTVRYYARMSRFFAPDVREKYNDLPHSHFALALQYEDHWKEILDVSLNEFYRLGKCRSKEWLESNVCVKFVAQTPPEENNPPVSDDIEGDTEEGDGALETSARKGFFVGNFVKALGELIKYVETHVKDGGTSKRIIAIIESLEDELNSL